jgi:hypothetical protein
VANPIRKWHDAKISRTAFEISPDVAVQVYNRAIHNSDDGTDQGGPVDQAGARLDQG